jgi:pSer/pThr/pTyr-binding forkhead associated (FHA) protein
MYKDDRMTTITNKHGEGKTQYMENIQGWYDDDHNEWIRWTQGKLEDKTRYIWIMTTMNKHSESKTQLIENLQGWPQQTNKGKTQWMKNTY